MCIYMFSVQSPFTLSFDDISDEAERRAEDCPRFTDKETRPAKA